MLMEGITIINQTEIMSAPEWMTKTAVYLTFFIFIITIIGSVFAGLYKVYYYRKALKNLSVLTATLAIVSAVFVIIFVILSTLKPMQTTPTGKYKYEVTIDKSVPMTEFYEKYEIIEQRGEIFVIKEKEKD